MSLNVFATLKNKTALQKKKKIIPWKKFVINKYRTNSEI